MVVEMLFSNAEFDPETLRRLTRAFEMAWNYLETNPDNKVYISHETAREDLALLMMTLVRSGERNPIRIANLAIDQMRQSQHSPIKSENRAVDEDHLIERHRSTVEHFPPRGRRF